MIPLQTQKHCHFSTQLSATPAGGYRMVMISMFFAADFNKDCLTIRYFQINRFIGKLLAGRYYSVVLQSHEQTDTV